MPGSVTNVQQVLPVPAGTEVPAASITGTGDPGLDGTRSPYTFVLDKSDPSAVVPLKGIAQDGTDSSDANATQATAGVGMRGWLSTLVSLFRAGTAKVQINGTATVGGTVTSNVGTTGGLALEGTDSSATTAVQATAGVGIRGWLSTLVSLQRAGTSTLTSVAASATTVQLLAANSGRKGLLLVNDSTSALYVAFAGTATTSAYSVYVPGSSAGVPAYWEMPRPPYTGVISGIWSTATGSVRLSELS